VLTGLSLDFTFLVVSLLDGGFETTFVCGNHKKSNIGLGGTRDHVLDEVPVSRSVDDGVVVLVREKFFRGAGNGHTSSSLVFGLVHEKGEGEGRFSLCVSFSFQFFEGTVVNTSEFKHKVSRSGGLSGIDVTDHDNTKMFFSFSHG